MNELPSIYFYVGKIIREMRTEAEMTQEELAEAIGVARTTVVHWEEGKFRVGIDDLLRIANYFDLELGDFLPAKPYKPELLMTRTEAFVKYLGGKDEVKP